MMDSLKNIDMKSKGVEEGIHELPGEQYALNNMDQTDLEGKTHVTTEAGGVAVIEASQMVFGKHGKKIMWLGVALMRFCYQLDNSTVYVYQNYAPSTFNALSQKATLSTACLIVSVVANPPIAKISDIIGRSWTLVGTVSCYLLSYILVSASQNFAQYGVGLVFYTIAQTGTNIVLDLIVSDISSARWRTLAVTIQFAPFLVMPWVAALMIESVLANIGWRWGVGMLAFIYPPCGAFLIGVLFYYQRKAKKMGIVQTAKLSFYKFFSLIDGGGLALLCAGFGMFFLPISLASTTPSNWKTGWIIALMVVGGVLLISLPFYEKFLANHPILPTRYFKNKVIVLAAVMYFLDSLCFSASHSYLYSWATISHNYDATRATFFIYLNGVVQATVGILVGLVIAKLRRYKWILFGGTIIRALGYGIMIRLRGTNNRDAELFIVQAVQGVGDGIVTPILLTMAQLQVSHQELGQITAIILMFSTLGSGVGSSIAGGLYTNLFLPALRSRLGAGASETVINSVYNSITAADLPAWGTPERIAANAAYSDVIRTISIAALCISAPLIVLALLVPNVYLPDKHNLVEGEASAGNAVNGS